MLGAIGACGLGGTSIVLFLWRVRVFAFVTPGTPVDTSAGMTTLRLFAPMAGISICAILAC